MIRKISTVFSLAFSLMIFTLTVFAQQPTTISLQGLRYEYGSILTGTHQITVTLNLENGGTKQYIKDTFFENGLYNIDLELYDDEVPITVTVSLLGNAKQTIKLSSIPSALISLDTYSLNGVPGNQHITFTTQGEINTAYSWNYITDKPIGFADNIDNELDPNEITDTINSLIQNVVPMLITNTNSVTLFFTIIQNQNVTETIEMLLELNNTFTNSIISTITDTNVVENAVLAIVSNTSTISQLVLAIEESGIVLTNIVISEILSAYDFTATLTNLITSSNVVSQVLYYQLENGNIFTTVVEIQLIDLISNTNFITTSIINSGALTDFLEIMLSQSFTNSVAYVISNTSIYSMVHLYLQSNEHLITNSVYNYLMSSTEITNTINAYTQLVLSNTLFYSNTYSDIVSQTLSGFFQARISNGCPASGEDPSAPYGAFIRAIDASTGMVICERDANNAGTVIDISAGNGVIVSGTNLITISVDTSLIQERNSEDINCNVLEGMRLYGDCIDERLGIPVAGNGITFTQLGLITYELNIDTDAFLNKPVDFLDVLSSSVINTATWQTRISNCASGEGYTSINQDGSVNCSSKIMTATNVVTTLNTASMNWSGIDDVPPEWLDGDYALTGAYGIDISSNALNINNTEIQSRVVGSCSNYEKIVSINEDGTVVCGGGRVDVFTGNGINSYYWGNNSLVKRRGSQYNTVYEVSDETDILSNGPIGQFTKLSDAVDAVEANGHDCSNPALIKVKSGDYLDGGIIINTDCLHIEGNGRSQTVFTSNLFGNPPYRRRMFNIPITITSFSISNMTIKHNWNGPNSLDAVFYVEGHMSAYGLELINITTAPLGDSFNFDFYLRSGTITLYNHYSSNLNYGFTTSVGPLADFPLEYSKFYNTHLDELLVGSFGRLKMYNVKVENTYITTFPPNSYCLGSVINTTFTNGVCPW